MGKIQFISLGDALSIITDCFQAPPNPYTSIPVTDPRRSFWDVQFPEISKEYKLSEAASTLNDALECSSSAPRLYRKGDIRTVQDPSARKLVGEILDRAIDLYRIRQKERQDHLAMCLKDGIDPLKKPIMFSVAKQEWQPGNPVGFDRSELITFLNQEGIAHPFEFNSHYLTSNSDKKDICQGLASTVPGEVQLTDKELAERLEQYKPQKGSPSDDSLKRWREKGHDRLPCRTEGMKKYYRLEEVFAWYERHTTKRAQTHTKCVTKRKP